MTRDYGMFTDFGNDAIDAIVTRARVLKFDWPTTFNELMELYKSRPEFSECMDTEVRGAVYDALGFKTPFYL